MSSFLFDAHVKAIISSVHNALPELRRKHGDSLNLDNVIDTIGTQELMDQSFNASARAQCAAVRGAPRRQGLWIDIPELYERALQNQAYKADNNL